MAGRRKAHQRYRWRVVDETPSLWRAGWVRQSLISLVALGLLLGLKAMPFELAETVTRFVAAGVDADTDLSAWWAALRSGQALPVLGVKPHGSASSRLQRMRLPAQGAVTRGFGWGSDAPAGQQQFHPGIDLAAASGTPILATLGGNVAYVGEHPQYGLMVELEHGDGITTVYAHCAEVLVRQGAKVLSGEVIARVGATGDAASPHLHFEVRLNGQPVDPIEAGLPVGK